jgi:cytidylate kinase
MSSVANKPDGLVVAIDGPSGSGKSSVAKGVARTFGLAYLDTGAMYRAATWWCREQGVDLDDGPRVTAVVAAMPLVMGLDPAAPSVHVSGVDIGEVIRRSEISAAVSQVATNLDVRAGLVARQQAVVAAERLGGFSGGRGIVVEGRDITTVVVPDAQVRVLLTASPAARLARRATEVHGSASAQAVAATRDQVLRRDADDSTVVEFHQAAPGVTTVDSTDLDLDQTVAAVLALVVEATGLDRPTEVADGPDARPSGRP